MFASGLARPLLRRLLFRHPVPADYLDRFFAEYGRCASFSQMFDLITADWFASLKPMSVPSGLLWGEQERVLRADQIDDFRRLLPGALVERVAGWDHFPMIEQPEEYCHVVHRMAQRLLVGVSV